MLSVCSLHGGISSVSDSDPTRVPYMEWGEWAPSELCQTSKRGKTREKRLCRQSAMVGTCSDVADCIETGNSWLN